MAPVVVSQALLLGAYVVALSGLGALVPRRWRCDAGQQAVGSDALLGLLLFAAVYAALRVGWLAEQLVNLGRSLRYLLAQTAQAPGWAPCPTHPAPSPKWSWT